MNSFVYFLQLFGFFLLHLLVYVFLASFKGFFHFLQFFLCAFLNFFKELILFLFKDLYHLHIVGFTVFFLCLGNSELAVVRQLGSNRGTLSWQLLQQRWSVVAPGMAVKVGFGGNRESGQVLQAAYLVFWQE